MTRRTFLSACAAVLAFVKAPWGAGSKPPAPYLDEPLAGRLVCSPPSVEVDSAGRLVSVSWDMERAYDKPTGMALTVPRVRWMRDSEDPLL